MRASSRLAWAADVVAPEPADSVLEVGCGHGVLLGLLADRAREVVGLDRSPAMTAAAYRRNRAAVDAGRVQVLTGGLVDADLDGRSFDVVVSFNVRAFWTAPAPEWDVVRKVLAPAGRVFVAWQVMGVEAATPVEESVVRLAGARGLDLAVVHRGRTTPTESLALELRPR